MKLFDDLAETGTWCLVWVAMLYIVSLCWVGAEYLFDGGVHSSQVDGAVAGILSFFIAKDLKKLTGRRR